MRLLPLSLVAGSLLAQSPAPSPVQLAPVTVEGRLLNESPATITRLDLGGPAGGLRTPADLADRAANLALGDNAARSFTDTYALRGLTNTPIFGGPALSCYLDDVPLGQPFTFPGDLTGFAVAELHRGPTQNTRFGRAGSAGVLTLATPEPAAAGGEVRVGIGDHGARHAALQAATGARPAGDVFASAARSQRDGFVTNTRLGRTIDDQEAFSGLARFRWRPAPGTELTFLSTVLRARDGVQPLVPLGGPLFTVARSAEGLLHLDAATAGLTAAVETGLGRLTATTSHTDWKMAPYASTLGFGFAELDNRVRQRHRAWNQEVRLVAPAHAPVRWQAGVFGSRHRTEGAFDRFFGPFPFERSAFRVSSTELAAYGEAAFQLAPAWQLTGGMRLESARRELRRDETVPTVQTFGRRHESTALLPKLGLGYTPDRQTTVFLTVGAGYKPGGFSAFTGNRVLAAFGPERTRTLEAGITRTTASQRLAATVRVFGYAITGYQIERSFATSAVADDYLVVNAPRARSVGGEVELAWRPRAGLTVTADLGVTRATLREFTDPFTGANLAGNRAPFVPDYDASLRIEQRTGRGWFAGAGLTARGRTRYTEDGNPFFAQGAVALLSAWAGYEQPRWRLGVTGRNLADEGYYRAITPGTFHGTPGAPRMLEVELAWRW